MDAKKPSVRPTISSIGVDGKGKTILRVLMPNGSIRIVDTNTASFAMLAAAGVQVINGHA